MKISTKFTTGSSPTHQRSAASCTRTSTGNAPALGIVGGRGVGKTTLLLQRWQEHFGDVEQCLYISADHVQVAATGIFTIGQEFFKLGGKALIIDEVHTFPDWTREIKSLYDTYRGRQLLLSGSCSSALLDGARDLSRRVAWYDMPVLSFREHLALVGFDGLPTLPLGALVAEHVRHAQAITARVPAILGHFERYLARGAYPFFVESDHSYLLRLHAVVEKVLAEDIPAIFGVGPTKVPVLKKLLWIIAMSQPYIPNIEGLSRDLALSKEYVYLYLEYLERSRVVRFLRAAGTAARQARKPAKILLDNPNLLVAIAGSTRARAETGTIRETFFASQVGVRHHVTTSERGDFVVDGKLVVEVGGPNKTARQLKGADGIIALDGAEIGAGKRIPLYLFGFLY